MDWFDRFGAQFSWVGWIAIVAAVAVPIVTYFFLHEDPAKTSRRRWRTVVIVVGLFVALNSAVSALRSGRLQHALTVVQQTVGVQQATIGSLKRQLGAATEEMQKEQAAIATQGSVLREQDAVLRRQSSVLSRAKTDMKYAKSAIRQSQIAVARVKRESRDALRTAQDAAEHATSVMRTVHNTNMLTAQRLFEAKQLATEAAAKAGVFRLPDRATTAMLSALRSVAGGSASIACAPGLEAACTDLGNTFRQAGWRTTVTRGASFFTGGGLDAQGNANPSTGLIVWYRRGREELATQLASILKSAGVNADARADNGVVGADIGVSLLFVTT